MGGPNGGYGPEWLGQDHPCRRRPRPSPLCGRFRALGPSVVPGELGQDQVGGPGPRATVAGRDLLTDFMRATGLTVPEARSLLAKFGLGARRRRAANCHPVARRTHPGAIGPLPGRRGQFLGAGRADQPSRLARHRATGGGSGSSYEGTLLIVTHDRRLLDGLRVTHRVEVADGKVRVELTAASGRLPPVAAPRNPQ